MSAYDDAVRRHQWQNIQSVLNDITATAAAPASPGRQLPAPPCSPPFISGAGHGPTPASLHGGAPLALTTSDPAATGQLHAPMCSPPVISGTGHDPTPPSLHAVHGGAHLALTTSGPASGHVLPPPSLHAVHGGAPLAPQPTSVPASPGQLRAPPPSPTADTPLVS